MAWSRTSRHARGYGTEWNKARLRILERDRHLCQPCLRTGRVTAAQEVNHKVPKAQGGTDNDDNLEAICTPCHKDETTRQQGKRPMQAIGADGWPT
jgi:5-methylcytosine-specific restriction protein A